MRWRTGCKWCPLKQQLKTKGGAASSPQHSKGNEGTFVMNNQ